jgi:hypothetical protein
VPVENVQVLHHFADLADIVDTGSQTSVSANRRPTTDLSTTT